MRLKGSFRAIVGVPSRTSYAFLYHCHNISCFPHYVFSHWENSGIKVYSVTTSYQNITLVLEQCLANRHFLLFQLKLIMVHFRLTTAAVECHLRFYCYCTLVWTRVTSLHVTFISTSIPDVPRALFLNLFLSITPLRPKRNSPSIFQVSRASGLDCMLSVIQSGRTLIIYLSIYEKRNHGLLCAIHTIHTYIIKGMSKFVLEIF